MPETAPHPAPHLPSVPATDLSFKGKIQVTQKGSVWVFLSIIFAMAAGSMPGILLAISAFEAETWKALIAVAGICLGFIGMFAGPVAWWMVEDRWRKRTGRQLFQEKTLVIIDAQGMHVEGLGHSTWDEVLSYEGIPDSESALVVYTRRYGGLMLDALVEDLRAVLDHYLDRAQHAQIDGAGEPGTTFRFRALVFHYPTFLAWITAGYLMAILMIGVIISESEVGFLKTSVALFIVPPMVAWLTWTIPFWQMSAFSAGRMAAFSLTGTTLTRSDSKWAIDVRATPAQCIHARGIGYALEFISFAPKKGRRLDLVMEDRNMETLVRLLEARNGFDFSSR